MLRTVMKSVRVNSYSLIRTHSRRTTGCRLELRRYAGSVASFNQSDPRKNHTTIEWQDGHVSEFHNAWLRDHCRCEKCIDPSTFQRSFDTLDIAKSINENQTKLSSIQEDVERNEIIIEWQDFDNGNAASDTSASGVNCKTTRFPSQWLRDHCYKDSERDMRKRRQNSYRKGWTPSELYDRCHGELPSLEHTELMDASPDNNNAGLKQFLKYLDIYGIVFVKNCPLSLEETEKTVRRFGNPRETTPWGLMWDTKPNESPKDTAYTNIALLPHTDCCYLEDQVALQVFNCVAKAGDGGASTWIDGFKVAEDLKSELPHVFEFFSTVKLPYFCVYDGVDVRSEGPVFQHDANDVLRQIRFNNYDRAPIDNLTPEEVEQFYTYLPDLYERFRDKKYTLKHTLDVGEMVVIDNWRVLHGREEFEGYRNLRGCYVGRDDIDSTKRQHIYGTQS